MWSSFNPILNGHFLYPRRSDIDRTLNEDATDEIRDYRPDYNNRPSNTIVFMTDVTTTCVLNCEFQVCVCDFWRIIGKPTVFFRIQEFSFRNPTSSTTIGDVLLPTQIESRKHTSQDRSTTY